MKDFFAPLATLLVAASFNGATAAASSKSEQESRKLAATARDLLTELLSASPENPEANAVLGVGGWTDALACTVDLSIMGLIGDEATCKNTTDSAGGGCSWCDASALFDGIGACVSDSIKTTMEDYWDQFCAVSDDASDDASDHASVVTRSPTAAPGVPVVTPSPTAAQDDDNDNIPRALKCSVDGSMSLIADKETCEARKDASSTSGDNCAWCKVPLIGGNCLTNGEKKAVHLLCKKEEEEETVKNKGKYLRGVPSDWKKLDPSCLGEDGLAHGDVDGCGAKVDSQGNQCIWCAGGEHGLCATPTQMDFLSTFMTCVDPNSPLERTA